ncbi:MAG TPA: hypothetical protein VIH90_04480, partial [Candidatus Saccharimonadales bacterium]
QAKYLGVIFNEVPTYDDIVSGTPDVTKITGVNEVFVPVNFSQNPLAGYTSRVGNPFLSDFILLAEKLDQLGFTYYKGKVVVVEPIEEQKHV